MRLDDIRKLISLLEESDLHEIEVARFWGLGRVRLTKNSPHPAGKAADSNGSGPAATAGTAALQASAGSVATPAAPLAVASPPVAPAATADARYVAIKSPMVGIFYRSPAPDADAYVEVGQTVEAGQTVCIVEAMKLMNEIESDVRGRIVAVRAENKQPVEYGQVLFLVDPAG